MHRGLRCLTESNNALCENNKNNNKIPSPHAWRCFICRSFTWEGSWAALICITYPLLGILYPILVITLFLHLFHVLNKCWTNLCLYPAFLLRLWVVVSTKNADLLCARVQIGLSVGQQIENRARSTLATIFQHPRWGADWNRGICTLSFGMCNNWFLLSNRGKAGKIIGKNFGVGDDRSFPLISTDNRQLVKFL